MAKLIITDLNGQTREVEGETGLSVMENIRDAGFDELLALCGGCCSCATCHVYVDESQFDKLDPIDPDEDDLLSMSEHRAKNSRLSCQIEFTDALDGLKITIAKAE
ncbi:MAG: 2Fe-2S iron-sulfur cluster-binding protein [Sphingomonadales bacterium]|jgi:2Fe-2S ferredoxin